MASIHIATHSIRILYGEALINMEWNSLMTELSPALTMLVTSPDGEMT